MTAALSLRTTTRAELVDITTQVAQVVARSGVESGLCLVYCPHTTAGITINEGYDPDVTVDLLAALERLVPWSAGYRHAEGNSAAHVKASLMGASHTVMVVGGRLQLGRWQAVWFCEFDGPRTREVAVTVMEAS